jgi:hypothetical protein
MFEPRHKPLPDRALRTDREAPAGLQQIQDQVVKAVSRTTYPEIAKVVGPDADNCWCLKLFRANGALLCHATIYTEPEDGRYFTPYSIGWNGDARQARYYFRDREDAARYLTFLIRRAPAQQATLRDIETSSRRGHGA